MRPIGLLLLTLLGGCSPAPAPVATSPLDPSNPSAPESAPPPAAATNTAVAAVYACPMHPEVTADHPGTCPKCGMHLVPKK